MEQSKTLILEDLLQWPSEIRTFLDSHYGFLKRRISKEFSYAESQKIAYQYDAVLTSLQEILKKYYLIGYHCTRLTDSEMEKIRRHGMHLPNPEMLKQRICQLLDEKIITPEISAALIADNLADDECRKEMLWFCYFKPYIAGEMGIERFFRSWGGEALYNCHESMPTTGRVISQIGTPCIIEAQVAIEGMHPASISINISQLYMHHKGCKVDRQIEFEGWTKHPIPANDIINIIEFPDRRFEELTKCKSWYQSLK